MLQKTLDARQAMAEREPSAGPFEGLTHWVAELRNGVEFGNARLISLWSARFPDFIPASPSVVDSKILSRRPN